MSSRQLIAGALLFAGAGLIAFALREPGSAETTSGSDTAPGVTHRRLKSCELDYDRPKTEADNCFVRVPGGTFRIGAQSRAPDQPGYDVDAGDDESPPHEVELGRFWMLITEVTAGQYDDCLRANACDRADVEVGGEFNLAAGGRHLHPVNGVSWRGADRFCRWIGGRLPTEAEWEAAARGAEGLRFPWGDEPADCSHAVMTQAGGGRGCGLERTQESWLEQPRAKHRLGLRGLSGSVWEWTSDWYDAGYYAKSPAKDPRGPESGTRRVQRGGAWTSSDAAELRGAFRAALDPELRMSDVGFRCVAGDDAVDERD